MVQRVKEIFEAKPQLAELVQEHGKQHQTLNAKNELLARAHTEPQVETWIGPGGLPSRTARKSRM